MSVSGSSRHQRHALSNCFAVMALSVTLYVCTAPVAAAQEDGSLQDLPQPTSPPIKEAGNPDGGTIHDSTAVTNCLCGSQRVSELGRQMQSSKQGYDDDQARLQQIQAALEKARLHIDVNNAEDVSAFRRLSVQREEISSRFYGQTLPVYSNVVRQYNEAVAQYNAQCAGRGLDSAIVAQVQQSLICRAPELP